MRHVLKLKISSPVLLLLYIIVAGASGSNITLLEYTPADRYTPCTNGLMADVDTAVFKCQVEYTNDKHMKHVTIQVKKKNENRFTYLDHVNVNKECGQTLHTECRRLNKYVLEIKIKIKASKDLSGAAIRCKIITSDRRQIVSEQLLFPSIFDRANTIAKLLINGHDIATEEETCLVNVHGLDINTLVVCRSELSPCLIEISADDSSVPVRGYDYLAYSRVYANPGEVRLTIKGAACSLKGRTHQIQCVIRTKCPNCGDKGYCDRVHGHCTNGCQHGFAGSKCDIDTSSNLKLDKSIVNSLYTVLVVTAIMFFLIQLQYRKHVTISRNIFEHVQIIEKYMNLHDKEKENTDDSENKEVKTDNHQHLLTEK